jgi:hypothetical protein
MKKGKDRSFVQENTFHVLRLQQSTSEPNVQKHEIEEVGQVVIEQVSTKAPVVAGSRIAKRQSRWLGQRALFTCPLLGNGCFTAWQKASI